MVKDCHLPSPMLVPFATLAATFCASGATLTARKVRCQLGTLHLHWTLVPATPVYWTLCTGHLCLPHLCTGHCALDTGHLHWLDTCVYHTCPPPSIQTLTTAWANNRTDCIRIKSLKQVPYAEVLRHVLKTCQLGPAERWNENGITIWGEISFWKEKNFEIRSDTLELPPGLSISSHFYAVSSFQTFAWILLRMHFNHT